MRCSLSRTAALAALGLGLLAPAQDISISASNAVFTKDFEASRTALFPGGARVDLLRADTGGDPAGVLFKSSWIYRTSNDTREYMFNDVGGQATYNSAGAIGTAVWTDVDGLGLMSAVATYRVMSTGANSGVVIAQMDVTNISANPLTLTVFHFIDFDICGAAFNQNSSTSGADGRMVHTSTCGETAEAFVRGADRWETQTSGNLYGRFGNTVIDNLVNNTANVGPGDIRSAFQWDNRTIAPGDSETFVVQMSHNDVNCGAVTTFYGPDAPISSGPVGLTAGLPPIVGMPATVNGTNYVANAPLILFTGLRRLNVDVPALGMTLLADPLAVINLGQPSFPNFTVGFAIPNIPALCGAPFFNQLIYVDSGAPNGLAGHSRGFRMLIGTY